MTETRGPRERHFVLNVRVYGPPHSVVVFTESTRSTPDSGRRLVQVGDE